MLPMLLKENTIVSGRFEVLQRLGCGGIAEVYRARDLRLGGEVCLKVLLPHLRNEPILRARFEREVAAVRGLEHPNIIRIFELLEDGDLLYFTMQYLPGSDLKGLIQRHGGMPTAEIVNLGTQLASALAAAHEQGIVHRDVSPNNVLVSAEGVVKLVDFGLAHMLGPDGAGATSMNLGAPLYTAPELLGGAIPDPRVDLYSLGCVLFEMATGRLPFASTTPQDLVALKLKQPPPKPRSLRPELPLWLEQVVLTAMATDPEERFQTAEELGESLRAGTNSLQLGRKPLVGRVETAVVHPEAIGVHCPRCGSAYLPLAALCLDCGYEPLSFRERLNGPYMLVLEARSAWSAGRFALRPGRDPLTYEQKWKLSALVQELCGAHSVPVEEMDLRLRALPAVLFDHLAYEAAVALKGRFDAIGVPASIRHRYSPWNVGLLADHGHTAALLSLMMLSVLMFLALPFFNLGLTLTAGCTGLVVGCLARLTALKPLGRLPEDARPMTDAPLLAQRCRDVLPRLRSVRLRKQLRKILGRYVAIHGYLGEVQRPALQELRSELPGLEELGNRALDLAETIQRIESSLAGLREAELADAVQTLDTAIDESSEPGLVEEMMRERQTQARTLEALRDGEKALSALYGDLIRIGSVLGGWLGRIGTLEGRLEGNRMELPVLLERLETRARTTWKALEPSVATQETPRADGDAWNPGTASAIGAPEGGA